MIVKDTKGRKLMVVNDNGQVAISRYVHMSKKYKECVADIYSKLTGESKKDVIKFLNYEENENIFCS